MSTSMIVTTRSDTVNGGQFSYFNRPITNTHPSRIMDLAVVHELIIGPAFREATERLRQLPTGSKERGDFKAAHFDSSTFSGTFSRRQKDCLICHSGLLTLDFDDISDPSELKHQLSADLYFTNGLLYISPSGKGLKWIIHIDISEYSHENWFDAVANYIFSTYGYEADRTGRDVCRASFLCHDPDAILTTDPPTMDFDPSDWLPKPHEYVYAIRNYDPDTYNNVEALVREIEEKQTDLTQTYRDWITIGFALSDEFKESGRPLFHRLSRFYPGYDYLACDKQYSYLLRSSGSGVTIRSLFYLALNAGVSLRLSHSITGPTGATVMSDITYMSVTAMVTGIYGFTGITQLVPLPMPVSREKEILDTPTFDPSIFNDLPGILSELNTMDLRTRERDICLLGSLGVMSACLQNVYTSHDGCKFYPNLYFFVVAPASAGKGKLNLCQSLGHFIDEERRNGSMYNGGLGQLFLPANTSSAGLIKLLDANKESGCIMFESEIDTLTTTLKQDWGNYSDILRKAWHHEKIYQFRRTGNESLVTDSPRLSVVMAGTPRQYLDLFSNAENGLFSRVGNYLFDIDLEWRSDLSENDSDFLDDRFKNMGEILSEQYRKMTELPEVRFSFTDHQIALREAFFKDRKLSSYELVGDDILASIHRMAIIFKRITMILAFEREASLDRYPNKLVCSDLDFEIAMSLIEVLIDHAERAVMMFPEHRVPIRSNKKDVLLDRLPREFDRQKYIAVAQALGIRERTAEGYIQDFAEEGKKLIRVERGLYRKL
ncbi:MAG TPA: DUF3987 domain-containing protein [Bacteroidales bacterium]|nr:DUF3987 domain-containing protein [Bacteroidales bacterium]